MSDSSWQRGYMDGFAKLPESPPNKNGPDDRENRGYFNGYEAGLAANIRRLISERRDVLRGLKDR